MSSSRDKQKSHGPALGGAVCIAHNIRSLHNIGSIMRTADGAGFSKVYCTGYSGSPDDAKAAKVSLGAEKSVPWEKMKNTATLIRSLKRQGYFVVALEQDSRSIPLSKFRPKFPLALIVGNEVRGLSPSLRELADACIEIPMRGSKESLNVSVAFGVAAYAILGA